MSDDSQLLRRFVADRSEAVFGEIVRRHLSLVYSAALRQTNGDAYLAQDVAQLVFTDLARKAATLGENVVLAGWLHRASVFAARQILRGERRRQKREQEAVTMNAMHLEADQANWQQIRPLLDDALNRLNPTDRDALLLRFFESQSLAQVGAHLGNNEDAARKRVDRALEKLRAILIKRGVTTTSAALSAVITANAMQSAPAGLALTLANASLTAAGMATTFTLLKIMTATQIKLGIGALAIAGAAVAMILQNQTQIQLRERNAAFTQQLVQMQTDSESFSNRLAHAGDGGRLSDEQYRELLKLRGEVGVLREQIAEVGKLKHENLELRNKIPATQPKIQLPTQAESEWHATNTMNAARLIV
jgi:RNA polymerase sigma factor (sigma-70 family)